MSLTLCPTSFPIKPKVHACTGRWLKVAWRTYFASSRGRRSHIINLFSLPSPLLVSTWSVGPEWANLTCGTPGVWAWDLKLQFQLWCQKKQSVFSSAVIPWQSTWSLLYSQKVCKFLSSASKQASNSAPVDTSWVPSNPIHFWHCLPANRVTSHKLRAWSPRLPFPDASSVCFTHASDILAIC
jgi:hypothetical protein